MAFVKHKMAAEKTAHFANGRFVRNVFESLVMSQAMRISQMEGATRNQLAEISSEDVQQVFCDVEKGHAGVVAFNSPVA